MTRLGDVFGGTDRFTVLGEVGQGGMGVVYEAFDRARNVRVALKTIQILTPGNLLRFKNEFRALQDLQHPNLVRLDELFEAGGTWFFTMELVDGVDFLRFVRPHAGGGGPDRSKPTTKDERPWPPVDDAATATSAGDATGRIITASPDYTSVPGELDEARLRDALRQLAHGLRALHDAGKVHRDVKPANILVTPAGRLVLVDFGLVADAGPHPVEGRPAGTLAYMAPEQIAGGTVGPAADWYAVGVMLYAALTGRSPFAGHSGDLRALKLSHEPAPPREVDPRVPADLDRLCADLLRRDPTQRPDAAEILRRLGAEPARARPLAPRVPGGPFVGRQTELRVLRDACVDVLAGRAVAVLIHGESGVGKTALVQRFLDRIAARASVVLAGRCYERESVPYKAFDQVIDQLAGHLAAQPGPLVEAMLPDRIALVAEVFPALRRVPAIEAAMARLDEVHTTDRFQHRRAVFGALRALFGRLGGRRPLVISIDDLHWADPDSLALLSHLLQGAGAPPVLVCATVRTTPEVDHVAALRGWLGDDVRELAVDRLGPAAARDLVDELVRTSGGRVSELRADSVAIEAAGHPMFIEALVRHQLAHPDRAGPVRFDDAVVAAADQLAPAARSLLDLVCIAGAPIAQEVCGHAAELPPDEIDRALAALRAGQLVRTHGARGVDAVEAYHDRVRDAVLARIAPDARPALHRRLGHALARTPDVDPERIAVHLADGGEPAAAARHADRAAARALAALAFEQAARLCRWALALDPGGDGAHALRVRLADALGAAGRGREAAEVYLAAADEVPADEQLELRRRAAEQLLISGRIDDGLRVLRTVLASVGLTMPRTPRRAVLSLALNRVRVRLRGGGLRPRLRDAATIPADLLTRIDTCWSASIGLATVDTLRGADFQTRHLLLALDAGEPYRLACALTAEAGFSASSGGPARARTERVVRAVEALAERVAHPNARGYAAFARGVADYLLGRWRAGLDGCDRAATLFRDRGAGVSWWIDTVNAFALECLAYLGDTAELIRRVPALVADAEARGDLYAASNFRIGLPNLAWLLTDDVDAARGQVAEAMAAWSTTGFHIQHLAELLALVQADLYAGDGAGAYRRVTTAWDAMTGAFIFRAQLTRIATYHQRARAALAAAAALPAGDGARRDLIADARHAARALARERMPWSTPLAAIARAGAAHLDGDDAAARAQLTAAIADFDAADMSAYAAASRRRLGALEGGDAGQALITAGTATLAAGAARRPDRVTDMLVPGF